MLANDIMEAEQTEWASPTVFVLERTDLLDFASTTVTRTQ